MVGEVEYGWLVGCRTICDTQGIVGRERISNLYIDIARESGVPVGGIQPKCQQRIRNLDHIPNREMEAFLSSVQTMSEVIFRQIIFNAIEGKLPFVDTVSIAAYKRTKIIVDVSIIRYQVVPEHYIAQFTVFIRDHKRYHTSAIVRYTCLNAIGICQGI